MALPPPPPPPPLGGAPEEGEALAEAARGDPGRGDRGDRGDRGEPPPRTDGPRAPWGEGLGCPPPLRGLGGSRKSLMVVMTLAVRVMGSLLPRGGNVVAPKDNDTRKKV